MMDGPTWADFQALQKEVGFLMRQSGRQPLREAGGGGGVVEFVADDLTALEAALAAGTIKEGAFCRTKLEPMQAYRVLNDVLELYAPKAWIAATFAALSAIVEAGVGDLGYTEDHGNLYGYRSSGWRILHPFLTATAPSLIGEMDGDRWVNGGYVYVLNTTWMPLPKVVSSKGYLKCGSSDLLFTHLE